MDGAGLVGGDSCSFDIRITVPAGTPSSTYVNTTGAPSASVGGTTFTGTPATASLPVIGVPILTKEFTDDPVPPGGSVTLQFTISHPDLDTAGPGTTSIAFTDDLAAALSGLAATGLPLNNICGTGSSLTGSVSDTMLTFAGGTLARGASCTFNVTLAVPAGATAGSHVNTTSSVTAVISGVTATSPGVSDTLVVGGLSLTKEFKDDPAIPGGTVTLEFTIQNSHPSASATTIVFTDDLAAALSGLASTSGTLNDVCNGTGSITGTTLLIFSGGTLAAGSSCTFSVTLLVPVGAASDSYANTTGLLIAILGGVNVTLPAATDTLVVTSGLLMLTKEFTDDPVAPGGTATLKFTLTNLHASESATDIDFDDDLNAALTGLMGTGLPMNNICGTGSALTGTVANTKLEFDDGILAAGASCTFNVSVVVPTGVTSGTTAINTTSSVTGKIGGLSVTGDPASDTLQVNLLLFTKSFSGTAIPGGTTTLTFNIQNLSATTAFSNLGFSDDLTAALAGLLATGLPASDVCGTGSQVSGTSTVILTGGNLPASGSCTFAVTLAIPMTATPGAFANTTSDLFNSGLPVGPLATASLTVVPAADLRLTKVHICCTNTSLGQTAIFTVTLTNDGPSAATGVTVVDGLPAGLSFVSHDGGGTAVESGGTVTWTVGTINAGSSVVLKITALADTIGANTNTAQVTASGVIDPDSTPNDGVGDDFGQVSVTVTTTLTVTQTGSGAGTVTSSPAGIACGADCEETYTSLQTVTLTAIPRADAAFAGWSGPVDCADAVVTVDVALITCTATFTRQPLGQSGPGGGAGRAILGSSLSLNGDAFGDVLAYADTSGAWARLLGDGAGGLGIEKLSGWSPSWIIRAARLNADALIDFVLYNQATGDWFKAMNNGTGDFTYFGSTWSPGWQVYIMDLNGDGLSDVFLYDPVSGGWYRGTNVGSGDYAYVGGAWDSNWETYPVNLNGDNSTDLFLHNAVTGQYHEAINNGVSDFLCEPSGTSCQTPGVQPSQWSPGWEVTPGDFNNNGRSDVFAYNPVTGVWFVGTNTGVSFLTRALSFVGDTWSPGWTVRVGDFNADGLADVFVYNKLTGQWFMELNDGAGGFTNHPGQWSRGWELYVVQANGDGLSDLLLFNATSGQWFQAVTTGPGTFSYGSGAFSPGATIVAEVPRVP